MTYYITVLVDVEPVYEATVNMCYDKGYTVYYGETEHEARQKMNSYISEVSFRYMELLGLKVRFNYPTYYNSDLDICKGTVTSSNINTLCSGHTTVHTSRSNVISSFKNDFTGSNTLTNILWTCHSITSTASNGDTNYNRSCSYGTAVFILNRLSESQRSIGSEGILLHELNHQYGAKDHYHELADKNDLNSCKFKAICSECGDNPRPASCIMYSSFHDINNSDIICQGCRADIINHLNLHHVIE